MPGERKSERGTHGQFRAKLLPMLAVITGASAGIGAEFARQLRARGYDLLLIARREDRLRELAAALGGAEILAADLAQSEGLERAAAELERRAPDLLVNNAGFGTKGQFHVTPLDKQMEMHQLHVLATVRLTRAVLPSMVARNNGGIINVASVASFGRSVGNASYCATKAWMTAFSEGLHLEMRKSAPGVAIQALCPGFTYSEFHDVTGTRRQMRGLPTVMWMDAGAVAAEGYEAVMRGRAVHVSGRLNRALAWLVRVLPQGLVRRVTSRTGSRYRKV